MEWFYANKSDQQVAFEENNFKALVESGSIKEDTLVWNEDLPDWRPCRDVRPEMFETHSSLGTTESAQSTAPNIPPSIPRPSTPPDNTDGFAVTSLILGIFSLVGVPLTGFAAILFGHISRKRLVERTGSTDGGGISLAGLILGYLGIVIGIATAIVFVALVIIGSNSPT